MAFHHWVAERDVTHQLPLAQIPDLQLLRLSPGPCEDFVPTHIDRISAHVWAIEGCARLVSAQVPDLDGVVPSTRQQKLRVIGHELQSEDTIGVAGRGRAHPTRSQFGGQGLGGLVVDADGIILASCRECGSIGAVVQRIDLPSGTPRRCSVSGRDAQAHKVRWVRRGSCKKDYLVVCLCNGVQALARRHVPVLHCAI